MKLWSALDQVKEVAQKLPNMTRGRLGQPKSTCLTGKPPAKWLQDTGARFDMVGKNNLVDNPETWKAVVPASKPFNILTGNGITKVKNEIQLASAAFGEQISPILLEHSPAALATGYRCKELGLSLIHI